MSVPEARNHHQNIVIDLSDVEEIELDAALVLVAEYHRAILGHTVEYRPPIDDANWPSWIRSLLKGLGFYDLVRAARRTSQETDDHKFADIFVPFISGRTVEGELVDKLLRLLSDAAGATPSRIAVYNALLEAMKNVKLHAYPDDAPRQLVPLVPHWWAAGAYRPGERLLHFVMYDQGVGIPATLPRRSIWSSIVQLCPPEFDDGDLLKGAIEFGRTSSGLAERGNGLWAICRIVNELPGSDVTILSGRGELTYAYGGTVRKKLYDTSFCGTLIRWSLVLPSET